MSRVLKILFIIAAIGLPLLDAGFWITNGYPFLEPCIAWQAIPSIESAHIPPLARMDSTIKLLGFLISLIPTTFNSYAFLLLARLFAKFERMEFFSQSSVKCIHNIGFCLLLNQLIYPVYIGMMSLALTFTNPPGMRNISIAFGSPQLHLTVIALAILLVSWVMEEGRKIHDEHTATI